MTMMNKHELAFIKNRAGTGTLPNTVGAKLNPHSHPRAFSQMGKLRLGEVKPLDQREEEAEVGILCTYPFMNV